MNSGNGEHKPEVDEQQQDKAVEEEYAETVVLPETQSTDNVGDASVEINVEELVAEIEGSDEEFSKRKKDVRQRLEELAEGQSFEDTYAIDFEDAD